VEDTNYSNLVKKIDGLKKYFKKSFVTYKEDGLPIKGFTNNTNYKILDVICGLGAIKNISFFIVIQDSEKGLFELNLQDLLNNKYSNFEIHFKNSLIVEKSIILTSVKKEDLF